MKTSSAKAKGRNLQKHLRDALLAAFPVLEPDDCKSTSMGASGEDVQLSPAARKLIPCSFECKSYAKIAVYQWFKQCKSNAKHYQPVLVIKQNQDKPLAVIDLEYFVELISAKAAKN
jgi:hypothetical protein